MGSPSLGGHLGFHVFQICFLPGKGSFIWLGIALGLILIVASDPKATKPWSKILLYVFVSAAIAIVIGEGLKYLLGRYRPTMLFEQDLYGFHFFSGR
ncbi:MAG TPA: hypothetical protein HPP90_12530 [Deltaproteobacteria bacterium]|nr:hypothetical protein [Deltaproteobacteria bacterium]